MNVKQLIEENNRKRDLLTSESEKYYSDLMIYIRIQWSLSEQKSEELLLELLDHLIDGQRDGKTAKDIFGEDAKAYADEIIEQLPSEDRRSIGPFISGIALNIIGWFLIIRSGLFLIISQFKDVEPTVNVFNVIIMSTVVAGIVTFGVWFIFKLIRDSLFRENSNDKMNMFKAGLFGACGFLVILITSKILPSTGPSFNFPWWASLLTGAVLLLVRKVLKRKEAI